MCIVFSSISVYLCEESGSILCVSSGKKDVSNNKVSSRPLILKPEKSSSLSLSHYILYFIPLGAEVAILVASPVALLWPLL